MNNWLNVFLVGSTVIIGGLLNYFYHPLMLKFLTIEEYGVFATLVSMFNILSIFVVGLSFFLNREISKRIENKNYVKSIFVNSIKIFFIVGIVIYGLYLLAIPFLMKVLKINDFRLFAIVGVVLLTSFVGVVIDAGLKALKQFSLISFFQIFNPIVKLILGFLLVWAGYKVFGAILAFVLSSIVGLVISLWVLLKRLSSYKVIFDTKKLVLDFWEQKKDIIAYLVLMVGLTLFMNGDILLARVMFDETTAGYYAGISMIGKFLVFTLSAIETVYYPQIMEIAEDLLDGKKEKIYLVFNPLKMYIILGLVAILANLMVGKWVLAVLKPELVSYFGYYMMLLFYFWGFAILGFFGKILVGMRLNGVGWILVLLFGIVLLTLRLLNIDNLKQFILVFIVVIWLANGVLFGILKIKVLNK